MALYVCLCDAFA
ncbi:hypothetical protein NMS59_002470 [Vibrio cholerae]|nr:hypothetical protein [Vibrio cholerae]